MRNLALVLPSLQPSVYRNLQKHSVYVIKSDGARGIDFSAEDGIDLMVMAPSPNIRAYQQLLGRVGRYNQPCFRAILKGASMVDEDAERKLNGEIARRTDVIRARALRS